MNEYYSIQDMVTMSGLSERTVRAYIKEGRLSGEKADGIWRFAPEQVQDFFEQPLVRRAMRANRNAVVYDFLLDEGRKPACCCAVVDLPVRKEETLREGLLELVNRSRGLRFVYHYDDKKGQARVILSGEPDQVSEVIRQSETLR